MCYRIVFYFVIVFTSPIIFASPKQLTIDDFMAQATLRDMDISPNGRYLAAIWNNKSYRVITIQDLNHPNLKVIAKIGDPIKRPYLISWANDERLLAHISIPLYLQKAIRKFNKEPEEFDINDYYQISRTVSMDINGMNQVMLMNNSWRISSNHSLSNIRHFLPNDPDHVLISAYKNNRRRLYKVNVYSGESEHLVSGGKRTYSFVSDIDGNPKYRLDYLPNAKAIQIFEYTKDKDWEKVDRIYFDKDEKDGIDINGLIGIINNQLIYIKKNKKTGYKELLSIDPKNNHTKTLVNLKDKDIISAIINFDSNEVQGYIYEDGDVFRNYYFNREHRDIYDNFVENFTYENFNIFSTDRERKNWLLKSYGRDNPGTFYLYNFENDNLQFYDFMYANLKSQDLAVPAVVNYLTRDKVKIRSYVLFPPEYQEGKIYPLIVMPHGGPHSRDYADYDDFAQFIATRGYIVIQPNFRGSTGYGKAFEEAGFHQWGGIMQDDLEDAVDFMVRKGYADKSKVCIVGLSYGGYAALMGVIKTPQLYECAVSINGVTDLVEMIDYDNDKFEDDQELLDRIVEAIGDIEKDKKSLISNSPLRQVDKIFKPLLIIAGKDDKIVPVEHSEDLIDKLENLDKYVESLLIKDTGHNIFRHHEDQEKIYQLVDDFLAKFLVLTK